MPETDILIQYVTVQRTERPAGRRVLQNGTVQRTTDDNPLPGPDELLERDRSLIWQDVKRLTTEQVQLIKDAVTASGFFDLPARLLINYCKEDPGATIWTVDIDGRKGRVVLYDPKPRRSPELDKLLQLITPILESA